MTNLETSILQGWILRSTKGTSGDRASVVHGPDSRTPPPYVPSHGHLLPMDEVAQDPSLLLLQPRFLPPLHGGDDRLRAPGEHERVSSDGPGHHLSLLDCSSPAYSLDAQRTLPNGSFISKVSVCVNEPSLR